MTLFYIFSALSAACLLLFSVIAVRISRRYKMGRLLTPSKSMFIGTALAAWCYFFPFYWEMFTEHALFSKVSKTILISAHHAIRLFAIDCDFEMVHHAAEEMGIFGIPFSIWGSILFVLAPVLTFSFILSFFKNFAAYRQLFMHYNADVYVFSELSEKSLALAADLKKNHPKAIAIFTDVFEADTEESFEMMEKTRTLGAICFKKDMLTVNLKLHSKKSKLYFFAIGEDEAENIKQAFALSKNETYKKRKNTFLYVFSADVSGELLLSNLPETAMEVRRVDDVRALVTRTLYDDGKQLFDHALPLEDGSKLVSAIVIGAGGHGGEMIKALAWFCQLDGYRIEIDAFDKDKYAADRFAAACPELYDERYNGQYIEGESQYKITFHTNFLTATKRFEDEIKKIENPTYVFVSLGSDELNIRTAVELRILFERLHKTPVIHAVVYDSQKKQVLKGAKNYRGQEYRIDFIGDLAELYSEKVIINSELEEAALQAHLKWDTKENLFRYEYNYRSSMASALHQSLRIKMGMYGAGKTEETLTEEERDAIERTEHKRWNAYMRSEGYIYSGSPDKTSRNDLGKMHHNLVPFDVLSDDDKRKDSRVGSK